MFFRKKETYENAKLDLLYKHAQKKLKLKDPGPCPVEVFESHLGLLRAEIEKGNGSLLVKQNLVAGPDEYFPEGYRRLVKAKGLKLKVTSSPAGGSGELSNYYTYLTFTKGKTK